jgi:hypothetical protein
MRKHHWIDARDEVGVLTSVMKLLVGNAHISFEGDLSQFPFASVPGASPDETDVLKRNTIAPPQDFVVLPLESDTIDEILRAFPQRGGVTTDILHVQIEKDGVLQFGAYDNFCPECVVSWDGVPEPFLQDLVERGIIRAFRVAPEKGAV